MTRYPQIQVSVRSANPLVLVAAVREEMRRAGVEKSEIDSFSREALDSDDPSRVREICGRWVGAVKT